MLPMGGELYNPLDSTTYYFGPGPISPLDSAGAHKFGIEHKCRIVASYLSVLVLGGTVGSGESSSLYIRKNDTTDYLITSSLLHNAVFQAVYRNTTLNVPLTIADFIEAKVVTPAWVTNPTGVVYNLQLLIEEN